MKHLIYLALLLVGSCLLSAGCRKNNLKVSPDSADTVKGAGRLSVFSQEFVVGIFVAPPTAHTTDDDYAAIRDANIDLIQDISYQLPDSEKIAMLIMAANHGLKMIVDNYRINGTNNDIMSMMNIYSQYPATVGYNIQDEPLPSQLNSAAAKYNYLLSLDSTLWPHVNLFPNTATGALAGINYEQDYVEEWINLVGPQNLKYLSIDNYPYVAQGGGDNGGIYRWNYYFQNLDVIRRLGLEYHIRTSAYLQSVGSNSSNGNLRRPDTSELRYSAYSILAYGITIPVWFTYWRPSYNFTPAIVDINGTKTDLYQSFKEINYEMHQIGRTLINLQAVDVYHTGQSIPDSTSRPPVGFVLNVTDPVHDSTIITRFLNPDENKTYVMVVNKSLREPKTISFNISNDISDIKRISKQTGNSEATNYSSSTHTFSDTFLPGDGNLYAIEN